MTSWTFSTPTPKRSWSTTKVENCCLPAISFLLGCLGFAGWFWAFCPVRRLQHHAPSGRLYLLKKGRVGRCDDAFQIEHFRDAALDNHGAQGPMAAGVHSNFDGLMGYVENAVHDEPDAASLVGVHHDLDFFVLI